jgi:hypothetical protein
LRRNKFLGFLFVFALVLFALPFIPSPLNPVHRVPAPSQTSDVHSASKKEMIYKQQTVKRDMEATERLARSQVARDVHNFLVNGSNQSGSGENVLASLKTHPEILYVEWMSGNKRKSNGSIAPGLTLVAKPYMTSARTSVRQGKAYSSPNFFYKGKSYFVHSQKAAESKESVVALISTDVVQAVERHQRRNLRLVPYPPVGR